MANQYYPLQLSASAQLVPAFQAPAGSHRLALTFDTPPGAGTVKLEYRLLGSPLWVVLQNAAALTSGLVVDNVDGPVEVFRVTFAGLSGGVRPGMWVSTQDTAEIPLRLLTDGGDGPVARMRVDNGQTGFFARRMWSIAYEFASVNPINTTPLVFRLIIPTNFIVHAHSLTVDQGGVTLRTYREAQGTPGGTFTPLLLQTENGMSEQPDYQFQALAGVGGTFTATPGEAPITPLRVRTSGATAQQASVGGSVVSEKGRPAGTYYAVLARMTGVSGDCTGVYNLVVEERPAAA